MGEIIELKNRVSFLYSYYSLKKQKVKMSQKKHPPFVKKQKVP